MQKEAIVICQPKDLPSTFIDELEKKLDKPDFKIKIIKTENPGLYAAMEWAIPTLIIAYLLKPFFETFLQEAGKDFYKLAKSELKKIILSGQEIKAKYIAASQSPDKLSRNYDQSITISLKAKIYEKLDVTVLFNKNIPDEEADEILEAMFEILSLLFVECQKFDSKEINKNQRINHVYLISNNEIKKWEILTEQQMFERYKN